MTDSPEARVERIVARLHQTPLNFDQRAAVNELIDVLEDVTAELDARTAEVETVKRRLPRGRDWYDRHEAQR